LDFGTGPGYFSIPAAKRIKCKVYALDFAADMLERIKEKAQEEQVANRVPLEGSMQALPLFHGSIDRIIASLVVHEIQPLDNN
jgi:ubiquinone/menaquinone biosynthesis C-methylase UbiE